MHRHWVPGLSQGGRGLGTRLKSSSQTHPGTYTCGAVAQSLQGCIIKVLGLTQNCGYTCLEPCCNTSWGSYTFHSNCPEQNSLLQIYVSLNRLMTLWEATRDQVRDHCVPNRYCITIRSQDTADCTSWILSSMTVDIILQALYSSEPTWAQYPQASTVHI